MYNLYLYLYVIRAAHSTFGWCKLAGCWVTITFQGRWALSPPPLPPSLPPSLPPLPQNKYQ